MNPFITEIFTAFFKIVSVPFTNPELLWQIVPIILMFVIMETYFGMHKHEKLGWNTALGNGISLFWIIISSLQYMFTTEGSFAWDKFGAIIFLVLYAMFIIYISFTHKLSAKKTYVFSSPVVVYFSGYLAFIYAYGKISANIHYLIAILLAFGLFSLMSYIYRKMLPNKEEVSEEDSHYDFGGDFDKPSDEKLNNSTFDSIKDDPLDKDFKL